MLQPGASQPADPGQPPPSMQQQPPYTAALQPYNPHELLQQQQQQQQLHQRAGTAQGSMPGGALGGARLTPSPGQPWGGAAAGHGTGARTGEVGDRSVSTAGGPGSFQLLLWGKVRC